MIKKEDKDFVSLETTLDPKTNAVTEAALIAEPSPAARKPRHNVKGSSTGQTRRLKPLELQTV